MELGKGVLTNGTVYRLQHSTATDLHLDGNSVGKDALVDLVWVRPSQHPPPNHRKSFEEVHRGAVV
jgi:hypothetical protein